MSMDDRKIPDDATPKGAPRDKKTQNSFLALGIVFLAVGIGMSFGNSSLWIVFLALGLAFLGVAAAPMMKKGRKDPTRPPGV